MHASEYEPYQRTILSIEMSERLNSSNTPCIVRICLEGLYTNVAAHGLYTTLASHSLYTTLASHGLYTCLKFQHDLYTSLSAIIFLILGSCHTVMIFTHV